MSPNRPFARRTPPSGGKVIAYYLIGIAVVAALAWTVLAVYPRMLPFEKKLERGYLDAAYSQALSSVSGDASPANLKRLVRVLVLKGNIGRADLVAHIGGVDDELLTLARGFETSALAEANKTGTIANHFAGGELASLRGYPVYQNLKFFVGYRLALLGDWRGAKDYFTQAWRGGVSPELKPFLQYYYGRSLILKGDKHENDRGYKILGRLVEGHNTYGLAARVSLNQLQAAIAANQGAFFGLYLSHISHSSKSWEYPKALVDVGDYYLKRDDNVHAADCYLRALGNHPEEASTRNSAAIGLVQVIIPLSGQLTELQGAMLTEDGSNPLYEWVQALAEMGSAKRAVPALSLAVLDERNLELRFLAMEALAYAYYETGNRKELENLLMLENLTPKIPDSVLQASYINYARLLRRGGETIPAIGYFKSAEKLAGPYGTEARFEEYTLMKERFSRLDTARSIELLRTVVKEPASKQRLQAAEELVALAIIAGRRDIAEEALSQAGKDAPDWEAFWRIFLAQQAGDTKNAENLRSKLKVSRFSYYELEPLEGLEQERIVASDRPFYLLPEAYSEYLAGYFFDDLADNVRAYGGEGLPAMKAVLLRNLELTSSVRVSSWSATEMLEAGFNGDKMLTDYMLSVAYPTPHLQAVEAAAKRYNVPAELIYAVMKKESNFDADAVSSVGARGLMQLMPGTAGDFRQFLPEELKAASINNPQCNISLGAAYLASLRTGMVQDTYVLSAYNGGPGNVNRWRTIIGTSDPLLYAELIPNDENEQFVKKTLKYSYVYRFILGSK
jgi:hypothetical protein